MITILFFEKLDGYNSIPVYFRSVLHILTVMLSPVGVVMSVLLLSSVDCAPLAESDGSNFQILSLIDRGNPQGPHFLPLNNIPGLQPTAKSFQVQWRPSFYSGIQTYQENLNKVLIADFFTSIIIIN